ncbi:MAG TPA: DUF6763 family protein [Gammaproteobacteria bacterium]|nr:DUF6763 family protein [Gammaproteobacteria bacterium]
MSRELNPVAGRWYRDLERDEIFKVVAVEENDDIIEIQHSDGETEEIESAEWFEMDLERAGEPEDWLREDEEEDEEEEEEEDRDEDWRDEDEDDEDDWDEDEDDEDDDRDDY